MSAFGENAVMSTIDYATPFVEFNDTKIFGTADTSAHFAKVFDDDASLQRSLSALQRGPVRFYRGNVIALDEDVAAYLLFVVSGVVRSCKICKSGTRSVVAFYLPGDLFGWIDPQLSLSIEAATDTEVLFIKRSGLLSLASRDARVANVLLRATTNELARAQEHVLLMRKSAKCRAATFLTDLWVRLGKAQYLDVPMSHQDIADYLGLTTETLSRSITDMERSGLIARVASQRRLLLQNHFRLRRVMLN
jgi:CRP/FNR family transcriptional regulator, nitrogen fixation regulation protein